MKTAWEKIRAEPSIMDMFASDGYVNRPALQGATSELLSAGRFVRIGERSAQLQETYLRPALERLLPVMEISVIGYAADNTVSRYFAKIL